MEEFESCNKCVHVTEGMDGEHCRKCVHNCTDNFKRATNADKIRNMTDDELTDFIVALSKGCLAGIGKVDCRNKNYCDKCDKTTFNWLRAESEDE